MRTNVFFYAALFSSCICVFAQQQPLDSIQKLDSVYIDTKISIGRKHSGKMVTVIAEETLQQNIGKSVAQVVNEVAGFEINGSNSNNGQNLGYFVRGGKNRQVLIIVDGVPVNDASQIANDYDLRLVPVANIEKIEILKGASSVLYGSGAATAVISITTKKASKKPFAVTTTSIFGTDKSAEDSKYAVESITNAATLSGTAGKFFYQADANHKYSNGISAIAATEGEEPFEEDMFNNFNGKLNLGLNMAKNITVSRFVAIDRLSAGFDDFSYTDAHYVSTTEQFRTGGHFQWKFNKGRYIFNDNYNVIKREIASSFPAKYDSKSYQFDHYLQYNFHPQLKAILGLNGNFSEMNSFTIPFGETQFSEEVSSDTAKFNYFDPYVNVLYASGFGGTLNFGVRANIHSLYGTNWVYQVNPSYRFEAGNWGVKLLGSYSTAYITPSLYQIYDPIYGNSTLQPEENTTIEGGFEISKGAVFTLSALYFQRKEENFVDFILIDETSFLYQYQNSQAIFEASGVEVELEVRPFNNLNFTFNYTYTKPDERFALRIPKQKLNANLSYQPDNKTSLSVSFQYVSDREDRFFNPETFESETITLEKYTITNFAAQRQVTKNIHLLLGLDNIFNTEFEELYRYQTKGRNIRLGFGLRF
ncbi:MAG: TonB-dependent receptor [Flavobacteriaceae bacterium]|nr:TonB-dependent receptor [Flavobacteriaceae bacterium]